MPLTFAALVVFFVGIAICLWRIPYADRRHVIFCVLAGVLWSALPLFEPSMRTSGYALVVLSLLTISLTQSLRMRGDVRRRS